MAVNRRHDSTMQQPTDTGGGSSSDSSDSSSSSPWRPHRRRSPAAASASLLFALLLLTLLVASSCVTASLTAQRRAIPVTLEQVSHARTLAAAAVHASDLTSPHARAGARVMSTLGANGVTTPTPATATPFTSPSALPALPVGVAALPRAGFNLTLAAVNYLYDRWTPFDSSTVEPYDLCTPATWTTSASCVGGAARAATVLQAVRNLNFSTSVVSSGGGSTQQYSIRSPSSFQPSGSLVLSGANFLSGSYWSLLSNDTSAPMSAAFMRMLGFDATGVGSYDLAETDLTLDTLGPDAIWYSASARMAYPPSTAASRPADSVLLPSIPVIATNMVSRGSGSNPSPAVFVKSQIFAMPLDAATVAAGWFAANASAASVLSRGAELVAVLNWVAPDMSYTSKLSWLYPGFSLTSDKSVLSTEIAQLANGYGVNKIVLQAGGSGVGAIEPSSWADVMSYAKAFLDGIQGVDILVVEQRTLNSTLLSASAISSGGGNIITQPNGAKTLVVACAPYMAAVCINNVVFDGFGNIITTESITQALNGLSAAQTTSDGAATYVLEDPDMLAQQTADYNRAVAPALSQFLIRSDVADRYTFCPWAANNCSSSRLAQPSRFGETPTGSIVADAARWAMQGSGGSLANPEIALLNAGSIRGAFTADQNVSYADVIAMLPLSNSLVVAAIRGEDLLLMLEHALAYSANDDVLSASYTRAAGSSRFLHASGLRWVWNPSAAVGRRVVSVSAQNLDGTWATLDVARSYRVVVSDYMVAGGDGFGASVFLSDGTRARVVPAYESVKAEIALKEYLEMKSGLGCNAAVNPKCNRLAAPSDTGRVVRDKARWPPVITAITPRYAEASSASTLTIAGANLGLIPVVYDALASPSYLTPVDSIVPDVSILVGTVACTSPRVAQVSLTDPSTQWNIVPLLSNRYNTLASVSALTCTQEGNNGTSAGVRVWISTLQPTYAAYSTNGTSVLGGSFTTRLDMEPLFNYTVLSTLTCPPDRSYLNAAGTCTCRAGWVVGASPTGAKICSQCLPGFFSATDDSYACQACPAGYSSRLGDQRCEPCATDTYSNSTGSASCSPCTSSSTTLSVLGATRCFCLPGFQEIRDTNNTMSCAFCPDGAECRTNAGIARALPGYWYDAVDTKEFHRCPNGFCCDRRGSSGCLASDAEVCYPHREGFLCGQCVSGYSSFTSRECIKCPGPNFIVIGAMILVALLFILLCLLENPSEDASTKLIVDYLQMCALILNPTLGINEVLSLIHLEFGSATTKFDACVMPMSPLVGIAAPALIPLGLFVILGAIHFIHYMLSHYACCCLRPRREAWTRWYEAHAWRYTNAGWEIILFGFMAIVGSCVQILDCRAVGVRFVVSLAPTVECYTSEHFALSIVALAIFCVLTFVVPIWLVSMLSELSKTTTRRSSVFLHSMKKIRALKREYKRQRSIMEDQIKKKKLAAEEAEGADLDQKILDLDEWLTRQMQQQKRVRRTGHEIVLWCYHAQHYWCEAAFLLRRVIFTLVTVLLVREKAAMVVTWLCIVILVAHAKYTVFRKKSSAYFHNVCLGAIAFQSTLNLDIYAQDSTGYVDFSSVTKRAQVVVVYTITAIPVLVGLAMFFKETFKERVRSKHMIEKEKEQNGQKTQREQTRRDAGSKQTGTAAVSACSFVRAFRLFFDFRVRRRGRVGSRRFQQRRGRAAGGRGR